jgi:TP901 family phage tail tape measure protein
MGFALGSKINLGSAVGYLLIDPRRFAQGLAKASSDMDNFNKLIQQKGDAAAKAAQASLRSGQSTAALESQRTGSLAKLEKAAATQAAAFRTANQQQVASTKAASQSFVAAQQAETKAAKDLEQALFKQAEAAIKLDAIKSAPPAQGGRFVGGGLRAKDVHATNIAAAERELAAADAVVTSAERVKADATLAAANASRIEAQALRDSILAAKGEVAAIDALEAKYAQLTVQQKTAFAAFDRNTQLQLRKLEDASAREIAAMRRLQAAREAAAVQRAVVKVDPGNAKALADLQRLEAAETSAATNYQRAQLLKARAAEDTTYVIEASAAKDIAAEEAAAAAAVASAEEVAAARAANKAKLVEGAVSTAAKAFVASSLVIGLTTAAFTQFDQEMTNVFSIMDAGTTQVKETTQTVRDLSVELGKSPTELAAGLYEIAQAGFNSAQATQILTVAATAAAAGLTSVDSAARPLIATINAYHLSAASAAEISDKLFVGVTAGVFSFSELASQLGDNVPLASSLKISLDELITSYIVLTKQGNSLSESTTQLNGIMNSFLKPTQEMQGAIESLGYVSGQQILEDKGLAGSLELITNAAGGSINALAAMFPNIRATRGLVALLNGTWTEYAQIQQQVAAASGTTQRVLEKQQKSAAFQFRVAREQIQGAAIDMGKAFVPAVLAGAHAIGGLAAGFSSLSPVLRGMITSTVLVSAGLSGTVAVIARLVSGYQTLADVIRRAAQAQISFNVTLGAVAFTAIALAIGYVVEKHLQAKQAAKEHEAVVKDLEQAYLQLEKTVSFFRIHGMTEQADASQRVLNNIKESAAGVKGSKKDYEAGGRYLEAFKHQIYDLGNPLHLSSEQIQAQISAIEAMGKSFGDEDVLAKKANDTWQEIANTPDINITKAAQGFNTLVDAWQSGQITGAEFSAMLDDSLVHLDRYGTLTDEDAQKELAAVDAANKLQKQKDDLVASSDDLIQSTLEEIVGFKDLVPWIDGVQHGLAQVGDTTAQVTNRLARQKFGGILDPEDMKPGIFAATQMLRAWEKVHAQILKTEDAMAQNQADMQKWGETISTVTDLFGVNTDYTDEWMKELQNGTGTQNQFNQAIEWFFNAPGNLPKLDALLAEGKLTQQEYNDAKEAGIWLTQRSAGGIQDEAAAQAKLLPAYAEYLRLADEKNKAMKDATPEQKRYLAMLQSEAAATFLNTLSTLAYLEALGLIPKEKVTKLITSFAGMSPEQMQFVKDLGLMDDKGVVVGFDINETDVDQEGLQRKADAAAKGVRAARIKTTYQKPDKAAVETANKTLSDPKNAVPIKTKYAEPDTKPKPKPKPETPGTPGAGTGGTQQTKDTPKPTTANETLGLPDKVTVAVDLTFAKGDTAAMDHLYGQLTNWVPKVTTRFRFVPSADYQKTFDSLTTSGHAAQANLDILRGTLTATFVEIATNATNLGIAAGSGFANGFGIEIDKASGKANAEHAEISDQLNYSYYDNGKYAGATYVQGLVNAIIEGWIRAYNAARLLGDSMNRGVRDATQQSSPSKTAFAIGKNYGQSLVASLHEQRASVEHASNALGHAMNAGIAEGALTGRSALSAAATRKQSLQGSVIGPNLQSPLSLPTSHTSTRTVHAGGISINVSGAGDPDVVADKVYRSLDSAFGRLELEVRK